MLDVRHQVWVKCTSSQRYVLLESITRVCFHHESLYYDHFLSIFSIFSSFFHILIFKNPKNHLFTIDQGFPIFKRILEAFDGSISFMCIASSFHQSFSLDFNILNFISIDSTSTHKFSKFKSNLMS